MKKKILFPGLIVLLLLFSQHYPVENIYADSEDKALIINTAGVYDFKNQVLEGHAAPAVIITAPNVVLKNVRIMMDNQEHYGLEIDGASNVVIENVSVEGLKEKSNHGIFINNSNSIKLNRISVHNVMDGIYINRSHDITLGDIISYSNRYGIHTMYSDSIKISNSELFNNRTSIMAMISEDLSITGNSIHSNIQLNSQGVISYQNANVDIENNSFTSNLNALSIQDSKSVTITDNHIISNQGTFHILKSDPYIERNYIVRNIRELVSDKKLTNISGNYYSDSRMIDLDDDGFSDTPKVFENGMNQLLLDTDELQFYQQGTLGFFLDFLDQFTDFDDGTRDEKPRIY
ncbi:MAG: right-handed parallel beta-helix repeat-containing protein [Staphylococcus equorum]|nr:right-handed parallel beta-helix repeat-containing protein [Staphylococcus equorum]